MVVRDANFCKVDVLNEDEFEGKNPLDRRVLRDAMAACLSIGSKSFSTDGLCMVAPQYTFLSKKNDYSPLNIFPKLLCFTAASYSINSSFLRKSSNSPSTCTYQSAWIDPCE
jgi:hypothetical protein